MKSKVVNISKFLANSETAVTQGIAENEVERQETVEILWLDKAKLNRLKSTMRKHGILPEARRLLWQSLVYRHLVLLHLTPSPVPHTTLPDSIEAHALNLST